VDVDDLTGAQRFQARAPARAVLDLIHPCGQVVAGRRGERLSVAAHRHPARGGRGHQVCGQPHHPVEEGVDIGRFDEQTEELTVGGGEADGIG
jgi:hypothetical protein